MQVLPGNGRQEIPDQATQETAANLSKNFACDQPDVSRAIYGVRDPIL
jgi:hypothetical protein